MDYAAIRPGWLPSSARRRCSRARTTKPSTASVAKGRTLTLRLTKRGPRPSGPQSSSCAQFPRVSPLTRRAQGAALERQHRTTSCEYVPGERLVLERNRFYRGRASAPCRPHRRRSRRRAASDGRRPAIASGEADSTLDDARPRGPRRPSSRQRYGVNRSQLFVSARRTNCACSSSTRAGHSSRTTRSLRQAVNFAVDRKAVNARDRAPRGAPPPTSYLSPSPAWLPGRAHLPAQRAPIFSTARALAKGHKRSGKAVLYTAARAQRTRRRRRSSSRT